VHGLAAPGNGTPPLCTFLPGFLPRVYLYPARQRHSICYEIFFSDGFIVVHFVWWYLHLLEPPVGDEVLSLKVDGVRLGQTLRPHTLNDFLSQTVGICYPPLTKIQKKFRKTRKSDSFDLAPS